MQKIDGLVIGGDGLIGRALTGYLRETKENVMATTRRRAALSENKIFLDMEQELSQWRPPAQVSTAYLCAAITAKEECRKHPERSAKINLLNTVSLAEKLSSEGAFVLLLSTNLVFDGETPFTEAGSPVSPRSEYGRQKALAEAGVANIGAPVSIIRLTKILAPGDGLFKSWAEALQANQQIHPYSDMVMAPVPLNFAIEVMSKIAELRLPGIMQVSGAQEITYAQAARYLAEKMGVDPQLVQPIEIRKMETPKEPLNRHSSLDTTRMQQELGLEPPQVWKTLDTVIQS